VNVAFAIAAVLALTTALIHGVLGERWFVMKLPATGLPQLPRFGRVGGRDLIRACWHLLTTAFAGAAVVLGMQAFAPADEAARATGRAVAIPFFGFAALVLLRAIRSPRSLKHPAWAFFLAIAALAWWGAA
jgi:hypothetical protein